MLPEFKLVVIWLAVLGEFESHGSKKVGIHKLFWGDIFSTGLLG